MICPECGTENNVYQSMSGGTEMWCYDHDGTFLISAAEGIPPRAAMLKTEEGRVALRAEMRRHLAERTDRPRCACGKYFLTTTHSEAHDRGLHGPEGCIDPTAALRGGDGDE